MDLRVKLACLRYSADSINGSNTAREGLKWKIFTLDVIAVVDVTFWSFHSTVFWHFNRLNYFTAAYVMYFRISRDIGLGHRYGLGLPVLLDTSYPQSIFC